jgi:hypothetical protein
MPQLLGDVAADVVADQVRVPPGGAQQPLRLVRGVMPPVCSACHQQFFRPIPDNNPMTSAFAVARGSTRANRDPVRANPSSNIDCHRTGFTLSPAASA